MSKVTDSRDSVEKELIRSLKDLQKTAAEIPKNHDYFFHPGKHLFFMFLKGIASGLGVIAAVAIVIPLLLWMMQGFEWIPFLGDIVSQIAERVEQARRP